MSVSVFGHLLDPRGHTHIAECIGGRLDGERFHLQRRGWSFPLPGGAYHFDGGSIPWVYRWVPDAEPEVQP